MRVLVIGAGVAGLAAARALSADGHEVRVFERAEGLRFEGAALTLWSNGTGILSDLGVSLEGVGARIDSLEQRAYDGRRLINVDVSRAARVHRHPHISLPRRRLLERLADGLPYDTITFGRVCTGVSQGSQGKMTAEFADGSSEQGDLVIGADGRNSAVRRNVWQRDPAEPSGWATWQGLSPVSIDITTAHHGLMVVGREGLCGLMPAGEGLLQWWFDLRWPADRAMPRSPLAELRQLFGSWTDPVPQVLSALKEDEPEFFLHYRHRVPRRWSAGRATLMGDAAHSMPPTRAQVANQALEDAWALATALRLHSEPETALKAYEKSRSRKAGLVSRQASSEATNRYRPTLVRLFPSTLASTYYTRWLRRISTYLPTQNAA